MDSGPKYKPQNIKLLHGNKGGKLWDLGFDVAFLDIMPKAYPMKNMMG